MKETVKHESGIEPHPVANLSSWSGKTYKCHKPEEHDKINAVIDILKGSTTAEDIQKRYGISSISSVYSWIGKYVSQEKSLSLMVPTEDDMAKKSKNDQIQELKAQLRQVRKEAELEKLRAHAYDTMITLAEEKLNIPIRKKSGTKQ